MASIQINGQDLKKPFEGQTLGSLLMAIRDNQLETGHFLSEVNCDGVSLNLREEEDMKDMALDSFSEIRVHSHSPETIISESLQNNDEVSEALCELLTSIAEKLRVGMIADSMTPYIECLEHVEAFLQIVNHIQAYLVDNGEETVAESMDEYIRQFLEISQEMLEAQNDEDYVLLADLVEYEVVPLLQDWLEISGNIKQFLQAA